MEEHGVPADTITGNVDLTPGTRVKVRGKPIGVTLNSPTGTVVKPDIWDGYYIIHLDIPALYRHADGHKVCIQELREAGDNLEILSPVTE
jgi:hypothetical protein